MEPKEGACGCFSRCIIAFNILMLLGTSTIWLALVFDYPTWRSFYIAKPGQTVDYHQYGSSCAMVLISFIGLTGYMTNNRIKIITFRVLVLLALLVFHVGPYWSPMDPYTFNTRDFVKELQFWNSDNYFGFDKLESMSIELRQKQKIIQRELNATDSEYEHMLGRLLTEACCGPQQSQMIWKKMCYREMAPVESCKWFYEFAKTSNFTISVLYLLYVWYVFTLSLTDGILCWRSKDRDSIRFPASDRLDYRPVKFYETQF